MRLKIMITHPQHSKRIWCASSKGKWPTWVPPTFIICWDKPSNISQSFKKYIQNLKIKLPRMVKSKFECKKDGIPFITFFFWGFGGGVRGFKFLGVRAQLLLLILEKFQLTLWFRRKWWGIWSKICLISSLKSSGNERKRTWKGKNTKTTMF